MTMNDLPVKLLLIDDSISFHKVVELFLRDCNVDAYFYTCAQDLKYSQLSQFDIALIDLNLDDNDISGIEVADTLKANGLRCPCIAVSGYHQDIFDQSGCFNDFYAKPGNKQKMRNLIEQYISLRTGTIDIQSKQVKANVYAELNNGLYILERGAQEQKPLKILKGCSTLRENAYINQIPSINKTLNRIQKNAKVEIIDTQYCLEIVSFIRGSLEYIQSQSQTNKVTDANHQKIT